MRQIHQLTLAPQDWLAVDMTPAGDEFIMRVRSLTQEPKHFAVGGRRAVIRGEEYVESWFQPSREAATFFEILPQCSYSKTHEAYRVAVTDFTAVAVARSWPRNRIAFSSPLVEAEFDRLLQAFGVGEGLAERTASFKVDGRMPAIPTDWRERVNAELAPYQRFAAMQALDSDAYALFMDRGTGKTPTAVQVINQRAIRKGPGGFTRVIVACPAQVRINWQREFEKFSTTRGKVVVVRGDVATRVQKLAEAIRQEDGYDFGVVIVGYDSLVRTIDYLELVDWDVVVCDESHYYKDERTNRWKAMRRLRDVSRARLILTGTPIGNSPMDLWTQLEFLRPGGSGFTTFKAFRHFHGVYERLNKGAHGVEKLIGLKNVPLLQERLARCSFTVTKDEAGLQLPDKVHSIEEVTMTAYQADFYQRLQEQLAMEIEDKLSGEVVDEVTVKNVLTMLLRLAQVTSGFITYDEKRGEDGTLLQARRTAELSPVNPKVDALMALLQDEERDPRAKTIVWCNFVHNINRVGEALTAAGIKHGLYYGGTSQEDRDRLVDQFNCDPEFKVLVCNPQTAGEGLNLLGYDTRDPAATDTYCDMEVFFSMNWSAIQRAQAEDRAHRRGTRMPVQVIDLVVPNTIDEEILDRVTQKRHMAETVNDLRDTLQRVLGRLPEVSQS